VTHLDELRRLAPPPGEPFPLPAPELPVPADYLDLAATYGHGEFCDLIVLNGVGGPEDSLDYEREEKLEDPEDYPYPIHPEPGGLLPWGATSNGDLLCWLTEGEPDTWRTVVWDLRGREFEEHRTGATEFLAGWLAGRVTSELLPGVFREHSQWFDAPRAEKHVSVRLSPHTQDLPALRETLGETALRRSVDDQHIVATGTWRVTYNPEYLEIAFPPEDRERVRAAMDRFAARVGSEVLSFRNF
jgi:hypothetical protein